MKSPVKARIMRVLVSGNPVPEIELARRAGFTKVSTIQKWITTFQNAGFIKRYKNPSSSRYVCQIIANRETIRKIYNYPEFRPLRPEIRQAPWFCPLFTAKFSELPGELPELIDAMVVASHKFFETIRIYDTPEKIREIYQPVLLLNRLARISDPLFDEYSLYYQIFVQAVIQDIRYGGLSEGFTQTLGRAQETLERHYPEYPDPVRKKAAPSGKGRR